MDKISIKTSARHIHLSKVDLEKVLGKNQSLTKKRMIDQPGQYVCEERLTIKGPSSVIENVAVVGPTREKTQVEISKTDAIKLGIEAPIEKSVNDENVRPGKITIVGSEGKVEVRAAIIPHRHIHINPEQAEEIGIENQSKVEVEVKGKRGLVFKNVLVRINEEYDKSMHIDTDEANAAGIEKEGEGEILIN